MVSKDYCLIVFAKEPVAGKVKTRLASFVGLEKASILYEAFLKDTYTLAQRVPVAFCILAYESFGAIPEYLYSVFPHFTFYPQHGNDLGARMLDAIFYAKKIGAKCIVIIGSDSPTLPPEFITEGFERLNQYDMVVGPSQDGGFYLLGLKDIESEIFEGISWGSEQVFDRLKANIETKKLSYYMLDEWHDIDQLDDLRQLVSDQSSSRAEVTMAAIKAMKLEVLCD